MTGHIKQNAEGLNPRVQKIGCFFRCCGIIAENQTGKSLSKEQINKTWVWAMNSRRIDENECVTDSASIANRFLRELGDNGRFYEIGLFKNGELKYYPSVADQYRRADALIQKIRQCGPSGTHFIVVDKKGNLVEDPHEPPIKSIGIEYSILYCYLKG